MTDISLAIDISETQYRIESGQAQKITRFQLISADTADLILFSDWSVSFKLCSDWLGELLIDEFQKWRQTDKQTNRQTYFISPC